MRWASDAAAHCRTNAAPSTPLRLLLPLPHPLHCRCAAAAIQRRFVVSSSCSCDWRVVAAMRVVVLSPRLAAVTASRRPAAEKSSAATITTLSHRDAHTTASPRITAPTHSVLCTVCCQLTSTLLQRTPTASIAVRRQTVQRHLCSPPRALPPCCAPFVCASSPTAPLHNHSPGCSRPAACDGQRTWLQHDICTSAAAAPTVRRRSHRRPAANGGLRNSQGGDIIINPHNSSNSHSSSSKTRRSPPRRSRLQWCCRGRTRDSDRSCFSVDSTHSATSPPLQPHLPRSTRATKPTARQFSY